MKKIFILFQTDSWNANPTFMGTFTTIAKAVKGAIELSKNTMTLNDKENLKTILQTQGRIYNYQISESVLNDIK